ncbi:L,D-transpeptidase family protein [Marimonas sp. MJW-29]|uniref:L,D-transpeptidase family protein n=1 Tax=Sulfitobacter sediminis TaxID=3234186 RepID=A0ABV3RMM5_9RHOB
MTQERFSTVLSRILLALLFAVAVPTGLALAASFQQQLDRAGIGYRVPAEGKAILVNIPAFELIAFENGRPVLRSRVIVGTPWNRTPRVKTYVSAVRFRPTWRPTPSMIASGEYRDRVWPPGERNPLGLAAVRLQPGLLVYLHDTNRRELFQENHRALSHGCIRVERWSELVSFVLDMDLDEVLRLAHGRRTFDAPAPPIQVELGYYTRFIDEAGRVVAYPDVYRLERNSGTDLSGGQETTRVCALDTGDR